MNNPCVNQLDEDDINNYESTEPLLSSYLIKFLISAQTDYEQGDTRILFYRGQSDKSYSLTPSVFRNGLLKKEHALIRELLLISPSDFFGIESIIERLIKMQRYGLPTRLLDVTMNPLVALFFACNDNVDKDGEVIVFYDYMTHYNDTQVKCLAILAGYDCSTKPQMEKILVDNEFNNIILEELIKLKYIPITVPLNNERIHRQSGAFIIVSVHGNEDGNPYQKVAFDLKPHIVKNFKDGVSRSVIIAKEDKPYLMKELSAVGINHAFLFPELEHQARYIQNKYKEV